MRRTRPLFLLLIAFATPSLAGNAEPRVVENPARGVWDEAPRKNFGLLEELFLGGVDPDNDVMLGRVTDIAVDSRGRILILDGGFSHVTIYDPDSMSVKTIGRTGEGPGEFDHPTAVGVDEQDSIYVASMGGRVAVFAPNGDVVYEFRQKFGGQYVYGVNPVSAGVYVVCLDLASDKLVHFYDARCRYVRSFSDARSAVVKMLPDETGWANGGEIDVGADGNVYYTQFTPYEIRKFSPGGKLLLTIHRDNDFIRPPKIERTGNSATFYGFTASCGVVALADGKIMNVVLLVGNDYKPSGTVVDLFDADGRLLKSLKLARSVRVRCRDQRDRVYAVEDRGVPQVVRYRIGYP